MLPLRIAALAMTQADQFELFNNLQEHSVEREMIYAEHWKDVEKGLGSFLLDKLGLRSDFTMEQMLRILDIIDTNCIGKSFFG